MKLLALAVSAVLVAGAFLLSTAAAEAAADAHAHGSPAAPTAPRG